MGWIQITSSVTLSNVTSSNNLSFNSYFKKPICWIMGLFRYRLLLKTENWKHYSKKNFKRVNSVVGPVNSAWTVVNSAWIVHFVSCIVNPCNVTVHTRWKKKEDKTRGSKTQMWIQTDTKCVFGYQWKIKIILLFSLFLLLFISSTTFFSNIHGFRCTISTNFYFYLQYF